MRQLTTIIFLLFLTISAWGQVDSSWNVLLLEKGNKLEIKPNMAFFSKTGFHLYRNCIYDFTLKNKQKISGRLIDIKLDTLVFENFFNSDEAINTNPNSFKVYYLDLKTLNLNYDGYFNNRYKYYSLSNYDFSFEKNTANYILQSDWKWRYIYKKDTVTDKQGQLFYEENYNIKPDSIRYENVPHFTSKGIDFKYTTEGETYHSELIILDSSKIDSIYRKKFLFWFTPCKAEEINGIAIGLRTENIKNAFTKEHDSLIVRGIDLQINPLDLLFFSIHPEIEDTKQDWAVKVFGLRFSINTISLMRLYGLNITCLNNTMTKINGMSISGFSNTSYILNGLSIATFANRAMIVRGMQIGIRNQATDLRGIQIGLWNTNEKRSLPLINWQFRPLQKK